MGEAVSVSDITLPNSFPPRYVLGGGAICMELLTKQVGTGWYVDLGSCCCLPRFVFLLLGPAGSQILPVPWLAAAWHGFAMPVRDSGRGTLSLLWGNATPEWGSCPHWPHFVALCPSGLEQCVLHRVGDYADQRNSGERESASTIWSQ